MDQKQEQEQTSEERSEERFTARGGAAAGVCFFTLKTNKNNLKVNYDRLK